MNRLFSNAAIFAVVVATLPSFAKPTSSATSRRAAKSPMPVPVFPYSQGWLGADDAYSIPLAPGKSLWLFGDTFVGGPNTKLRTQAKTMVHNSIGISTCERGKNCKIRYYWRNPEAAMPRSFFDTGREDVW